MANNNRLYQQNIRLGCGLLALITVFGLIAAAILVVNQELWATHYPGAIPMSNYTSYSFQRGTARLDNAYRTRDSVREVYDWYKIRFNLIPDGESSEGCLRLGRLTKRFAFQRRTKVWICETPVGQMILINREMLFR